jgi:hypothetical protein
MTGESYEGWANWQTWQVALWVNNDEPLYRRMRALRPFTAQKARLFVERVMPGGTPDMRGDKRTTFPPYIGVNWREIAEDFNAD